MKKIMLALCALFVALSVNAQNDKADNILGTYAAGTGTPQFGGLTSRMALTLLNMLFEALPIIGFDVVEIAPPLDPSLAAMYAGRKLITEAWGNWAKQIGKLQSK